MSQHSAALLHIFLLALVLFIEQKDEHLQLRTQRRRGRIWDGWHDCRLVMLVIFVFINIRALLEFNLN